MKAKPRHGGRRAVGIPPIRIVVVDDHVFMRELICVMLARRRSFYHVVADAGSVAEAIVECAAHAPDLLILDINLPDRSGLEAVPDLKRVSPSTRILLCTAFATEDRILEAIHSGADGFVEKTNTWSDFLDAIDRVSGGERYFHSNTASRCGSPGASDLEMTSLSKPSLSPRESEILKLIAEGSTSKEIAARLCISVQTVETHRANLMQKVGVHNVAGLVLFAVKSGLIKFPAVKATIPG